MKVEDRVPTAPNPLGALITSYLAADMLSGEQTTLLDRVAFMALPFGVAAAAAAGARDGAQP